MIASIDELKEQILRVLPQSNTIKQFIPDEKGDYVTFHWNGRDFLVRKSLDVFEVKNRQVFVTGASMLMQSALSSKNRHQRVLEVCVEAIRQVEGMLGNRRTTEQGLQLLAATKTKIAQLAGAGAKSSLPKEAMRPVPR